MNSGAALKLVPPRYQFTCDWVSPHIEVWSRIIDHVKPTQFLEVGCFEGRATTYLIERCSHHGPLSITCVDTWEGAVDLSRDRMAGVEDRFDYNVSMAVRWSPNQVTFRKVKEKSSIALPGLIAEGRQFDFIYIDGSHVASDVLCDAVDGFRLLRVGGAMILDDYVWCMEPHGKEDSLNMPKPAIDAFVNIFQRQLQLVNISSQLVLLKT